VVARFRRLARAVALPTALTGVQRVLLAALLVDGLMVVAGVAFAPKAVRSVSGVGIVAADLGLLAAIACASVIGPFALGRLADVADVCLWTGALFAFAYDGSLLLDFLGRPLSIDPLELFLAAGLIASGWAANRTRRLSRGVAAGAWALLVGTAIWSVGLMAISYGFWNTRAAYGFWLRDGAVSEFRRSGGRDLGLFLIQDIEGAVFFHPLLSLALGAVCGAIGAAVVLAPGRLRARL
jgi:hypothetical protein